MIVERFYTAGQAAAFLARHLKDGRDYTHLLTDQRRGRRDSRIPYQRKRGRILYSEIDLLKFIDDERRRGIAMRPEFVEIKTDRDECIDLGV